MHHNFYFFDRHPWHADTDCAAHTTNKTIQVKMPVFLHPTPQKPDWHILSSYDEILKVTPSARTFHKSILLSQNIQHGSLLPSSSVTKMAISAENSSAIPITARNSSLLLQKAVQSIAPGKMPHKYPKPHPAVRLSPKISPQIQINC